MSELKKISLKKLKGMAWGKGLYSCPIAKIEDGDDLYRYSLKLDFSNGSFFAGDINPLILTRSRKCFINKVKIVQGNCTGHTPISRLQQGKSYTFVAVDPIKFKGSVEGILVDHGNEPWHLIIKTSFGFFLPRVLSSKIALFLEIVE